MHYSLLNNKDLDSPGVSYEKCNFSLPNTVFCRHHRNDD